jgi:hypothetical protein
MTDNEIILTVQSAFDYHTSTYIELCALLHKQGVINAAQLGENLKACAAEQPATAAGAATKAHLLALGSALEMLSKKPAAP